MKAEVKRRVRKAKGEYSSSMIIPCLGIACDAYWILKLTCRYAVIAEV